MSKYDEFKTTVIGKIVSDPNGTYTGQCVSVVKDWIQFNGWPYKHGNAIDWQKNGDDFYKWIPNTPSGIPVQGDIIVLSIGKYGDVAIIESANTNTYDALGQNYPHGNNTDPVQIRRANYTSPKVVGWLHPKGLDTVTPPTPQVDPRDAKITELTNQLTACQNKPAEVREEIKEVPVEVIKYVDKEVIKDNPVQVERIAQMTKEVADLTNLLADKEKELAKKPKTVEVDKPLTNEDRRRITTDFIRDIFTGIFKRK